MKTILSNTIAPWFSTLDPNRRPLIWQIAAIMIGTALLALSSYITVPMVPVPVSMQTFAVTLIGALYGWRLGAMTVITWLVQGAVGMPLLAGGAAGIQHFLGPTGGYLFAFPVCAAVTGWLVGCGWNGQRLVLALLAMMSGNVLCLVIGGAWLALMIGPEQAFMLGVLPFLVGAVLKSALAAMLLRALVRS